MLCSSWDVSGCDGTFLFPQANGHVSQDQEEPVCLESTATAPVEEETQVGLCLDLCLRLCSFSGVFRSHLSDSEVKTEDSVWDGSYSVVRVKFSGHVLN